ncbi:MAG: hypothetical protein JJ863_22060 [Deltaproteobacteria bacterium]|nr:hypothetical protein [Deltaproteobacteria bacterium]
MRLALCLLLLAACDCDSSGTDADSAPTDASLADVPRRDFGPAMPVDCVGEALDEVFVLTTDLEDSSFESHLFRFDPETLEYLHVGEVVCPLDGAFLRSMAVDRNGNGYATDNRGNLFRVDTDDASCAPTGMETEQEGVRNFGMGYATVGDSTDERLYITATGTWYRDETTPYRRLLSIDTRALSVATIGDLEAPTPANMELTGTGDGRLFGMVLDVRDLRNIVVTVEHLDADTGATLESKRVPLDASGGFAFAQWGGDFWLFTEAPDGRARVAQFDWDGGEVLQTVDTELDVPGTIIGAGVSTCAPFDLI